jgi:hypothetical protein
MSLGEVEGPELSGANTGAVDGLEDATLAFTLISNLERKRCGQWTSQRTGRLICFRSQTTTTWMSCSCLKQSKQELEGVDTYNATHLVFPCGSWEWKMGS